MSALDDFIRQYNSWNLQQRLDWERFVTPGGVVSQERIDAITREYISQQYGAFAAYLNHAELGPILMASAKEGWTSERLQARISQTAWWQSTTASQREFDALLSNDPATANERVRQVASQVTALLEQQGARSQFSDTRIEELARQLVRNGVQGDEVPRLILAEVSYDPSMAVGNLQGRTGELQARAQGEWLVPLSEQSAFDWAKRIEMGLTTQEAMDDYFRDIAKATYGQNAEIRDRLESGVTMRQLMAPRTETVAGLLEIGPAEINWLDPKFVPIIEHADGGTTRMMSLAETQQYVRGLDEWKTTDQANQQAAELVEGLFQKMGVRAGAQ